MPTPNTGGQLRSKITDMQVGDYISCYYDSNSTPKQFRVVGRTDVPSELSLSGQTEQNGWFYWVMVEKKDKGGLLIADRVLFHSVSWDTLNGRDWIQGSPMPLKFFDTSVPDKPGTIRSLGGGNSYASATGTSQTTDAGLGAAPVTNEWDRYIVKKDYGTGAGRDDVWHWQTQVATLCQETPITSINNNASRVVRSGNSSNINYFFTNNSSATNMYIGFRPVFEYQEVTS